MTIFHLFEDMRRANAAWYTAHPLTHLSEAELADLAAEAGLTIEEVRQRMTTPTVEMTCPLCGQPATHLVGCKGCGSDAFGGEWVAAHGEDMHDRLRAAFRAALTDESLLADLRAKLGPALATIEAQALEQAARHAYAWGGCLICTECWHHTLPAEAGPSCPLKLLADRTLIPAQPPGGLFFAVLNAAGPESRAAAARQWIEAGWQRWVEVWNTVADEPTRRRVAVWRHLLWEGVWRK